MRVRRIALIQRNRIRERLWMKPVPAQARRARLARRPFLPRMNLSLRQHSALRRAACLAPKAAAVQRPQRRAVDATLRHAILRAPDQLRITREDLHDKVVTGRQAHLILLVVDASRSMAARRRMEAVKSCVLGLLHDAYRCRDTVGMIAFRGGQAELALPPT